MAPPTRLSNPQKYTVGWIVALPKELTAARAVLDDEHVKPENFTQHESDNNIYIWGRVGEHNIVIAALAAGTYGVVSAATTAVYMKASFPHLRFGLMVGIGAGIPRDGSDIRLGDVVVSKPSDDSPGVVQYDMGRLGEDGQFSRVGALDRPPEVLLKGLATVMSNYSLRRARVPKILLRMIEENPGLEEPFQGDPPFVHQGAQNDRLFEASSVHVRKAHSQATTAARNEIPLHPNPWGYLMLSWLWSLLWLLLSSGKRITGTSTGTTASTSTRQGEQQSHENQSCASCDPTQEVMRDKRGSNDPQIHYGVIASGNILVKDGISRDKILQNLKEKCLCFEMEAAGLMNSFPCLVIRGICDYADTHKNDQWQNYAAATAAAFAKELLEVIDGKDVERTSPIEQLRDDIAAMKPVYEKTRDIVQGMDESKYMEKLYKWLSPPDPSVNYNKALQQRHQGSGEWLLRRPDYATWKAEPGSFLWLQGMPGCGKTVLSSSVIEDLKNDVSFQDPLYFYFDFSDTNKQALDKALRSLIMQLYRQNHYTEVRKPLDQLFTALVNGMDQPDPVSLSKTFQNMVEGGDDVCMILDALDECQPRNDLLQWIRDMTMSQRTKLHILVTSRPEQDIESAITCWADRETVIPIQSNLITGDIQAYVSARVREHSGLNRWKLRPDIQQEIAGTLMKKADGMFRWVACQLDALESCLDYPTLKTALESLPEDLNETYARILANIPRNHMAYTRRILQFLIFSERPLRLGEVVDLIAVQVETSPHFDPTNRMPLPEEVLRYCSSLATMLRNNEIRLAHFSVKEYLKATDLGSIVARGSIAKICLAYLVEMPDHPHSDAEVKQSLPLAEFAAKNWTRHATIVQSDDSQHMVVHALTMELFRSKWPYQIFYELCSPQNEWRGPLNEVLAVRPALYYAATEGLSNSVQELVQDTDVPISLFSNCLYSASIRGHDKVVHSLLESNDSTESTSECYGEALYVASREGHEKVVQLLLRKGADANANAVDGGMGNALQISSKNGHKGVVTLLLQHGANVHAKGGEHGSALFAASWHGHEEIVALLLSKGATVNPEDKFLGTSLRAASVEGYTKVVTLLLRIGAYDNAKAGSRCSALCAAAFGGHEEIVRMLLDKSTNVHNQNYYDEALRAAAEGGHEGIFYILFDRGANFFQGTDFNGTFLSKQETWKFAQWLDNAQPLDEWMQTSPSETLQLSHQSMIQLLSFNGK